MTHNLRDWVARHRAPRPRTRGSSRPGFSTRLEATRCRSLVDYRSRSPHGVRAHPTDEHFLPLFFALGAAPEQAKPERVYDAIDSGVLAMDAYVFS